MTDEAKALVERANWRTTGEQQVADELREIAKELPCGQRQMHLEIAAQIVEQGQFLHPNDFVMSIELAEAADLIETQAREIERLRKLTCATWFYMPDEGDRCWFSPHEVIDEMYDPEPGNHVFEVECATSLPSIWCAVRVTNDPDADERFTFTEHATEAEARAALAGEQ